MAHVNQKGRADDGRKTCQLCGGALLTWFDQVTDPQTKEPFSVCRCGSCGLGITLPAPDPIEPYYQTNYYGGRHGFTATFRNGRRVALVQHSSRSLAEAPRVLDVGAGDGSFLRRLRMIGWDSVGTELTTNPDTKDGLIFADMDGVREQYGPASFDVITMWHSLEHFRDPFCALKQAARLLRADGRLLIAVPDFDSLQAWIFGRHWFHLDVPRHLFHFPARALRRTLEGAGFEIESKRHLEIEYDILGWAQSALNAVLRESNVLFNVLTRRVGADAGGPSVAASLILGGILSVVSVPMALIGAALGRGASIIVTARRRDLLPDE